ncbi:MAG: mechanosensitive ion channel family protein [Rhodospirillaceae bacterium]|jgi:MscS family membrane protein|nr:mechanosensitive ion channel family protein [Rhodospirillaceae bacterium]MBT4220601.1 mechanosensitive ion channel family protein [Rhodospirillaceae bacterium]MBT4464854.1 mechanosensitive ion channel family protein [Rhodospirillaceae bacterium]MBT5013561.1 mechanosensitive ion channel family protein [Rhodospirillaceae bacterium]MBT6407801.1 mechanosensitive ion channel family protein [Rhodospirillaceae bacterium]
MDQLTHFWGLVVDVWETGVFGVDISRILIAAGIFLAFLLVRHLLTRFVINTLKALTKRTKTGLDDAAIDTLEEPLRLIPIILGAFFVFEYLELSGAFSTIADNIVRSLIAFCIFWGFLRLVTPLSVVLTKLEKVFTAAMVDWLVKAVRAALIFIGAATILQIWGIEVGPILAGLGLFGVAVALGAQDLFKNLIAGILIIAEKRFNKGDWIKVDGTVEGTVETIGFRSTVVRRFDKAPVYVPNTKLSDSAVTNFTAMTHRRIYWQIGIEYRASVDQLRQVRDGIEAYVLENDAFAKPPAVPLFVRIDKFSDSSIDIMLYCFTRTTDWGKWLEIKEELAYAIKDIVEGAGCGFAFPSQSLYVEAMPAEEPEVFQPPETKKREKQS